MDPSSFLNKPQNCIHFLSWNINAVKTKLEKQNVYDIIRNYDLISLNEIKTPLKVTCPGYISLTSRDMTNRNRGGTCVLIKNQIFSQVTDVDLSKPDQEWLQLRCLLVSFWLYLYPPSRLSIF